MRQLALLGSEPAFASPLHVGRPNIGDREQFIAYANRIFDNRWLTNYGPLVQQFEQELSGLLGVKHCIAVCNATAGLEIAIRALGMQGEVITPLSRSSPPRTRCSGRASRRFSATLTR